MPLPFPEVHSKARSRKKLDAPRKLGLNFLILLLNWLAVGEKGLAEPSIQLGRRLNRQQWAVVSRLSPFVTDWNAQAAVTAKEMGRSAVKVESVEAQVMELEAMLGCHALSTGSYGRSARNNADWPVLTGHPGEVVGCSKKVVEHLAKDVDPDRLFFKGVPTFDPVPFLDNRNRHQYIEPFSFCDMSLLESVPLPKVKVRCGRRTKMKFLEKLDESNRLALLDEDQIRKGLENGVFCLPKDQVKDRLILDARCPNTVESAEKRWVYSLGSAAQLGHLFLDPNEVLVLHAEDLQDFYYSFKIGPQRQSRNCLKCKYRPDELQHLQCFKETHRSSKWLVPVLNTMAMGDTNAVSTGQTAHLSVILRTGLLIVASTLLMIQPLVLLPQSRLPCRPVLLFSGLDLRKGKALLQQS